MSLFSTRSLRARVISKFPAEVVAGSGITITKAGRVYTFSAAAANLGELINALTLDPAPVPSTDFLAIYDASAPGGKKITIETAARVTWGVSGYATNRYYTPGGAGVGSATTLAVAANRLYAIPIVVGAGVTWTRMGIDVTVAAGTSARLGIFTMGSDGLPGTLVLDAGTVSTASTGIKEATISQFLEPGRYYLVAVFDNTPTVRANPASNLAFPYFAMVGVTTPGTLDFEMYKAFAFGALSGATPFGAPTFSSANVVLIHLRVV